MGWNLPPGCSQSDIDHAAGGYDDETEVEVNEEPEPPEGLEEQWETADGQLLLAEAEDEMDTARHRPPDFDLPRYLWDTAIVLNRAAAASA